MVAPPRSSDCEWVGQNSQPDTPPDRQRSFARFRSSEISGSRGSVHRQPRPTGRQSVPASAPDRRGAQRDDRWVRLLPVDAMVLQHFVDLLLDLGGNTVEISRPGMAATGALNHYDGETLYEEHAADVLTIRALNREGEFGVATIHGTSTNQWRAADTNGHLAGAATRGRAVNAESPDDARCPEAREQIGARHGIARVCLAVHSTVAQKTAARTTQFFRSLGLRAELWGPTRRREATPLLAGFDRGLP
jgi:hypothetical protein